MEGMPGILPDGGEGSCVDVGAMRSRRCGRGALHKGGRPEPVRDGAIRIQPSCRPPIRGDRSRSAGCLMPAGERAVSGS